MITAKFNTKQFMKDMNNIVNYSIGFMEGAEKGKRVLFHKLGEKTTELLYNFIDSNARANPAMLHHIYEWERTGSPNNSDKLYDIYYTVSNLGLSFRSSFRQSSSVKPGSSKPFYNKARIMEEGIPVTIRATKPHGLLVYNKDGETVFNPNPVTVLNPGGNAVQGGFEKTFDNFFNKYFTQAFLDVSGVREYLKKPLVYSKNLKSGKSLGKVKGVETGYRWIANVEVDK
jgi:hypothetical protein